jgi:hypothetical protein
MNCKLKELAGARGLWISVILQNKGNTSLLIPSDFAQLLHVAQANAALWWLACEQGHPVYWEESTIRPTKFALSVPEGEILGVSMADTPTIVKSRLAMSLHYTSPATVLSRVSNGNDQP